MKRSESPVVSAEEVFAANKHARWVGLVSVKGNVILSKMRTQPKSASPQGLDEESLKLGPLTLIGVAEKCYRHLDLEALVACYGPMTHVHARLGSQIIVVSIENREDALSDIRDWLKKKRAILGGW